MTALAAAWPQPSATLASQAQAWRAVGLPEPAFDATATHAAPEASTLVAADFEPGDPGFIALCNAYRSSGGIGRFEDVVHWLLGRGQSDCLQLEAMIVSGQAFSFEWRGSYWMPLFQFHPLQPTWSAGARQVLAELGSVLDGWAMAAWFVRGNTWLAGRRPLDLLNTEPAMVLAAARTDRYVIDG